MSSSILKLLYSDSGEEESNLCDVCGKRIDESDVEICPYCNRRTKLPTMQEYGKRLPVGIIENEELNKEFDIEPLNWGKEKKISSLMASQEWKKRINLSNYIGIILAHTVINVGGVDITKFSLDKKLNIFKEMYQGDVFYMYAYLRLISNGHELTLNEIECTNNLEHKFGCVVDISAMKVMHIESISELKKEFSLENGIMLDKELRKNITIGPSKWRVLSIRGNTSEAEIMEKTFLDSLIKIEGFSEGLSFPEKVLDNMSKNDMNIVQENLSYVYTGPLWVAELECPTCGTEMLWTIDWTFKDFFTNSYTLGRR